MCVVPPEVRPKFDNWEAGTVSVSPSVLLESICFTVLMYLAGAAVFAISFKEQGVTGYSTIKFTVNS